MDIRDRFITCKVPIDSNITLNHFILPGDKKIKKIMDVLGLQTFKPSIAN